ncbi:MAG TPA: primosomal protein N', partial [Clostridiales bacterium]|nr:primosomal protein N' [Clostridiales bacterium]
MNSKIVKVAVENTKYGFDKEYSYLLPSKLGLDSPVGCRVLVPFGKGKRKRVGLVTGIGDDGDAEMQGLKAVEAVLDEAPLFNAEMLSLIFWLKDRTFCTLFEAAKALLPTGINLKHTSYFTIADNYSEKDISSLDTEEVQVLETIKNAKGPVQKESVLKKLGLAGDSGLFEKLANKGFLSEKSEVSRQVDDLSQKMVRLSDGFDTESDYHKIFKLTEKQNSAVELLISTGSVAVKELCYFLGVSSSVVATLEKKGIIEIFEIPVLRRPSVTGEDFSKSGPIILTEEQEEAYAKLVNLTKEKSFSTALLHGVTGSGKTMVYLKLIDSVLEADKNIIVMVPEIALTPQMLSIFNTRYGERIAIIHSALSLGERADEWKRIKNGQVRIVVGTRSAVFAPLENIGLIIIDEEQEDTYKSELSPRYHTHDVARFRCAHHKALLLLSSATPSVESYAAAKAGYYHLLKLNQRYGEAELAEVNVVDMRDEIIQGNTSEISSVLKNALESNLEGGYQSILMINRRGYNTLAACTACRTVVSCPQCSISLRYHSSNKRLMCHYCGYSRPYTDTCDTCGKKSVKYSGFGTQRIEEDLKEQLPNARILRMDTDSTMTRMSHESKLESFRKKEFDIMLGTQMVAKGLDFENVTLAAVISVDQQLYNDDFRSMENTFSLLTQVVGRSGRGKNPGKAIIQTFVPQNEIIKLATNQDYEAFFESEIKIRKMLIYPPYCDLCLLTFSSESESLSKDAALEYFEILKLFSVEKYTEQKIVVLGPAPSRILKVNNRYRYRLIIKCKNSKEFRNMISETLY